jgi:hypothetical protein
MRSTYTVSKVKTFRGRDGFGFHAVLNRDDVVVADVQSHASGGSVDFYWHDAARTCVMFTTFDRDDTLVQRIGSHEEALFVAHCDAQGTYESYGMMLRWTPATVAEKMAFDVDNNKCIAAHGERAARSEMTILKDSGILLQIEFIMR